MMQNCSFCEEPSVLNCMNRSLYYKYNEFQGKTSGVVDCILNREVASYRRYMEAVIQQGTHQFMINMITTHTFKQQLIHSLQYYKFRIFVPVFTQSNQCQILQNHYYLKLKHYYNGIKRKLHMEEDISESSLSSRSQTKKSIFTGQELLKDIPTSPGPKQISGIMNYKSESKALEELVSYMKLNSRFEQIQTLQTDDCFQQQHLFEQNIKLTKDPRHLKYLSAKNKNLKLRLFNKYNDNYVKRTSLVNTHRQIIPSKAQSGKYNDKEIGLKAKTNVQIESPYNIKQTLRVKSISKRYSSLGSLNKYSKKPIENGLQIKRSQSTNVIKPTSLHKKQLIIKHEEIPQSKKSIIKIQMLKFQNNPTKSTNRVSLKKDTIRKQRQTINTNDNIYSIRKKKLQMLKQKLIKTQAK